MLKHQKHQVIVYNANGVPFTIYKTTKPTRSGPKDYWVLQERLTTGKRRLLNNTTLKAAKARADKIVAAMLKGQASRMALTNGQLQDVCLALDVVRNAPAMDSLNGVGVAKDESVAAKWYRKAAEQKGHPRQRPSMAAPVR